MFALKNLQIFVKAVRVLKEAMIFLKEVTRVVIATVRVILVAMSDYSGHVSVDRGQWVCSKEP